VRATCHGIAAASGKLGAAVAAYSFPLLKTWLGIQAVLVICGVVAVLGLFFSLLFVPRYTPLEERGEIVTRYEMFRAKVGLLEETYSMNAGATNERTPILRETSSSQV
jgi:nitrate/nitrite transporter NarK